MFLKQKKNKEDFKCDKYTQIFLYIDSKFSCLIINLA
jgi:hypothetical protein